MTTKVNISEWERMISGRLYSPADPEIAKRHRAGMIRCDRFNRIPLWRGKAKQRALERLIPSAKGKNFEDFAPFYCEYGVNIHVGRNCFINYNSVFLDVAPITLGDNVWLGGNVTILPGVTIGEGTVIGAGSVVARDIPAGVVAVGNPCKVLRKITEKDSIQYKK